MTNHVCKRERTGEREAEANAIVVSFMFSSTCGFTRGSTSECILKLREIVGAPIDPHGLVTLLWALVVHAGEAPGRSCDLAAFDPVSLQPTANCRSSADMRSIAAFVGSHRSRGLGRERWYKQ
jgi:hypothetical protein